jgi:hypothetical protein
VPPYVNSLEGNPEVVIVPVFLSTPVTNTSSVASIEVVLVIFIPTTICGISVGDGVGDGSCTTNFFFPTSVLVVALAFTTMVSTPCHVGVPL